MGLKTIAILQSNYIPWRGYFDIIAAVDEFLLFDEVQFTRRDWRNRNRIMVQGKPHWLTIAVKTKGNFDVPINEVEVADPAWAEKHWRTIAAAYGKAEHFALYRSGLEQAYAAAALLPRLSDINELFLKLLIGFLDLPDCIGHTTSVARRAQTPTDRLVEICLARGADAYLSGPAAKAYIETERFAYAGVDLRYADYSGYPVYDQKAAIFEPGVSMLDALMRCGPQARTHLKSLADRDSFVRRP
jgi:hypothetical protein